MDEEIKGHTTRLGKERDTYNCAADAALQQKRLERFEHNVDSRARFTTNAERERVREIAVDLKKNPQFTRMLTWAEDEGEEPENVQTLIEGAIRYVQANVRRRPKRSQTRTEPHVRREDRGGSPTASAFSDSSVRQAPSLETEIEVERSASPARREAREHDLVRITTEEKPPAKFYVPLPRHLTPDERFDHLRRECTTRYGPDGGKKCVRFKFIEKDGDDTLVEDGIVLNILIGAAASWLKLIAVHEKVSVIRSPSRSKTLRHSPAGSLVGNIGKGVPNSRPIPTNLGNNTTTDRSNDQKQIRQDAVKPAAAGAGVRKLKRKYEVIYLDDDDSVSEGGLDDGAIISKIGRDLVASPHTKVIDCHGKVVSPGFVDTHHHVWQTQLKGRHSDDTLLDYTAKGNWQPFNYTASDVFWGELGGLLEAIDGGTTSIVDHAHMAYSPSHGLAGFAATLTAGLRSVYCLSLTPRLDRWDTEIVANTELEPDWFFPLLRDLNNQCQSTSGRVSIGLGFDSYTLPREEVIRIFETARGVGAKVITSHWRRNNIAGMGLSVPKALQQYELLKSDIILSHATGSTEEELQIFQDSGAFVSSTPATESQMAHGEIVGFRKDVRASIGADCHSNNPASLLHAMQIGLAVARSHRNSRILANGKFPREIEPKTQHAFNLATILGARAAGIAEETGSLTEGKAADIVVIDGTTPAMCCAYEHDPVAAVVRHAGVREIETVIVAGKILKENGHLVDVSLQGPRDWKGSDDIGATFDHGTIPWTRVAERLRSTRLQIQQRIDSCDMDVAEAEILKLWGSQSGAQILV
ncbi:hypothetical protein H2200_000543 [Cladophialophora chaetospira]|uniref:Amidohydrolase-related domain-containing protein n=1 Tax=Cladophialophora chaetospira TaxID=386627 RepID=A0AA39CPA1_9EURO|nr:hypothetical protein H2200_000543 [Cladophialophora chaetospira]